MVFNKLTNLILFPIYHLIHRNVILGFLHKKFINSFNYKNYKFFLDERFIPLKNYSSFLFKTYEYNDRALVERNLDTRNKCIIIGGGIGFIATLAYKLSKNDIIVFEINKKLIPTLKKNLKVNNCRFKLLSNNLTIKSKEKIKSFYLSKDFLDTSSKTKTEKKINVKNIDYKKIDKDRSYNTLIIDAEGDEEYYIKSLKNLKNIKFIYFELHYNIFNKDQIENLMKLLKKNNFILRDKCFNSFYFSKGVSKWKL